MSEGLGDCPEFRSAPGILAMGTGGNRPADWEAVEGLEDDARRETTLANSSAKLVVRASTVSCCDGTVVAVPVLIGDTSLTPEDGAPAWWWWNTKAANGLVPVLESDGVVLELDCCSCVKTGNLGEVDGTLREGVVMTGGAVMDGTNREVVTEPALLMRGCVGGEE